MEKPYAGYNKKMHNDLVVIKAGRPKVEDSWGPSLQGFLKSCWSQDLTKRPTAHKASAILKREASKVGAGGDLELNNFRRKSTFVNRDSLRESLKERKSIVEQMKKAMTEESGESMGNSGTAEQ